MTDSIQYERPNTVSGLVAKHKELSALRDQYKKEIKKLTVDIDHLEASIRLFDPDADFRIIQKHVVKHRAEKGSVKRFVLSTIREAGEPVTSRHITELWCEDRGLAADEATYTTIRKRIGACIKVCVNQGLIEDCGWTSKHDANGPYKLWRIKEGDA
ncbi:MAG: hypothetical protein ABNH53_07220 [Henriciella sp.]|jgi:hypothetical protein